MKAILQATVPIDSSRDQVSVTVDQSYASKEISLTFNVNTGQIFLRQAINKEQARDLGKSLLLAAEMLEAPSLEAANKVYDEQSIGDRRVDADLKPEGIPN